MAAKMAKTAETIAVLTGSREASDEEIADVEEPEEEVGGEAGVPCPPDAPGGAAPDHAGGEADGGVEDGELGGGEGEGVGCGGALDVAAAEVEVGEGGEGVEVGGR